MIQLPENFDSIFRYIEVVSQRAEQIIRGARPRAEVRAAKPTLQARDDVDAGAVDWRILTQEELDAQRQAMVEQFRAEMETVEEEVLEGVTAVDVLPTSDGEGPVVDGGAFGDSDEADDELQRLQRLLGMAGAMPDSEEEVSGDDDVDLDVSATMDDDDSDDEVDE